jgi:hypothetical protein
VFAVGGMGFGGLLGHSLSFSSRSSLFLHPFPFSSCVLGPSYAISTVLVSLGDVSVAVVFCAGVVVVVVGAAGARLRQCQVTWQWALGSWWSLSGR